MYAPKLQQKVCRRCHQPFVDTSPKNNQRSHPDCTRKALKLKGDPRPLDASPRLAEKRRGRVLRGEGGRLDDFATLTKFTHTWWGRVSELIFLAYRTKAKDVNAGSGARSGYDFMDPDLGRVDVRGAKARQSPQGRLMWVYGTSGLKDSCDHVLFVGYTADQQSIAHLWLVPSGNLQPSAMRFSPGSDEYPYGPWDVTATWGVMIGNGRLMELRNQPVKPKPTRKFAWASNPDNFTGDSPTVKGRRGEFLYQKLHPTSVDTITQVGTLSPYDFLDADGVRVNVKSACLKTHPKRRWTFTILAQHQIPAGHKCDLYSCLCLNEAGTEVVAEYRIPVDAVRDKSVIHVYPSGGIWTAYRVG